MEPDDDSPTAIIDRDLTALSGRLPGVVADDETFRRCRATGARRRRRRVLTAATVPMLFLVVAALWASHRPSGSTMVVTPATTSSATPTTRPDQRLAKISSLEVSNLPPGTKLFLAGDLRGMVWRSYILPNAPNDRLILSASAGNKSVGVKVDTDSLAGPGVTQTQITVRGDRAVLTRKANLARIDWADVRHNVLYTVLDSDGILTSNTLIKIADGLTAK